MSWSLHPGSLLLLSPKVTFSSRWGTQYVSGQVTAGLSGLSVRDVNGRMNVRFIRDLVPLYVGGVLELQDLAATLDGGRSASFESASGRLLWQDAVWTAHTGDVALGRYAVDVGSDGEGDHGDTRDFIGAAAARRLAEAQGRALRVRRRFTRLRCGQRGFPTVSGPPSYTG